MMGDLISREAALYAVYGEELYCQRNLDSDEATAAVRMARFKLEKVPAVNAIPVEWLERTKENYIAVATVLKMWQKEQEAQDG